MPPRFKSIPSLPVEAQFWLSGEGQVLVHWCQEQIQSGLAPAALILPLKTRFGDCGVEALELALGAERAREHTLPPLALIHRESLEQSSKPPFNHFHSDFFTKGLRHPCDLILEVGAGLGLDTIALAKVARRVITLEPNVQRARYVAENFHRLGLAHIEVVCKTLEDSLDLAQAADGIFADPSRRKGGERVRDPNECSPPLDLLLRLAEGKRLAVKLSPTAGNYPLAKSFRRCFVGSVDDARELIVVNDSQPDTMVVLDEDKTPQTIALHEEAVAEHLPIENAAYLYEPHPIVFTAPSGVRTICERYGLALLTSEHGYLGSVELRDSTPWTRAYRIIETVSFRTEKIQALVTKHALSKNTAIKKREHKVSPEALHKSLKWTPQSATQGESKNFALICIDSGTNQWCSLVQSI